MATQDRSGNGHCIAVTSPDPDGEPEDERERDEVERDRLLCQPVIAAVVIMLVVGPAAAAGQLSLILRSPLGRGLRRPLR